MELEVNTIIEDVVGWRNSKRIELLSSDDQTPSSQIGWAVPRECNTRMRDPKCSRDCKHRRRCDAGKYRSSEVNKSVVISIIDRNVYHELRQNVGSVNMIKRGDRFDR